MKSALYGILSAMLVLVAYALIAPLYSDYRARAETDAWLVQIEPLQKAMTNTIVSRKTSVGSENGMIRPNFAPDNARKFEVRTDGEIVVGGGRDGQVIILSPSLYQGEVTWHCVGGPDKDMPDNCKLR